jgi:DNA-binding MarR family transcriptional regulator
MILSTTFSTVDRAPLSVKNIAALLQMDSATLSPKLKRLQAQGLITRERSAADERAIHIELAELEDLRDVLTKVNVAALAAGALDSELDE